MSSTMLPKIEVAGPTCNSLSEKDLEKLAAEMREELIGIVRPTLRALSPSNLGVVEPLPGPPPGVRLLPGPPDLGHGDTRSIRTS